MKQLLNIVVLSFVFIVETSSSRNKSVKKTVTTQDDALIWFNKYGYNPCASSKVQCSVSFTSMLKEFQKRFGLQETGEFDETTKDYMNRPRCGNQDKPFGELNQKNPLGLSKYKWSRSSLTYSLRGYPTQLTQSRTDAIIREAFDAWLVHIPITITEVCSTCNADFTIDFSRGDHYDGHGFDGIGGTLAHAFFPEDGRVHFDKDEPWTERFDSRDINLYLVAVHEIGHALGVDHSNNKASIMFPTYQLMEKQNILPQPDRDTIQLMYGKKQSSSSSSSSSSTTRKTTSTSTSTSTSWYRSSITTRSSVTVPGGRTHPRCRIYLDAAFKHPDGTLHTFDSGIVWRYLIAENAWESDANSYSQIYDGLSSRITAGVYNPRKKEVIFFTSSSAFHYDIDYTNQATYRDEERLSRNLRNSIVGAIYYRGEVYVVTPKMIRPYQTSSLFKQTSERNINEEFPRFTGVVTTAFSYGDLHHFFTQDRLVYVWNEKTSSWKVFAKPMETNWFACSGSGISLMKHVPADMHLKESKKKKT